MTTHAGEVKRRVSTRARSFAVVVVVAVLFAVAAHATIPRPIRDALASKSARVRILGVVGVAKSGDAEATALLQGMLSDPDPAVRVAVVDGLVALKNPAAVKVLKALEADGDATVRAAAVRAIGALERLLIVVDTGDIEDLSDKSVPGLLPLLQEGVDKAIRDGLGAAVVVRHGAVDRGYGAVLKLRSLRRLVQDGNGAIEVKCDVTLVELPGKILRFTSSATAAAGVEGPLPRGMERELASDGINACAPSLAKDVADYIQAHRKK